MRGHACCEHVENVRRAGRIVRDLASKPVATPVRRAKAHGHEKRRTGVIEYPPQKGVQNRNRKNQCVHGKKRDG
jgi:hypothetical protein